MIYRLMSYHPSIHGGGSIVFPCVLSASIAVHPMLEESRSKRPHQGINDCGLTSRSREGGKKEKENCSLLEEEH